MIHSEIWKCETIQWAHPVHDGERFQTAIGATPNQRSQSTSGFVCVWRFESPGDVLRFIDPFFSPGSRGTLSFFQRAVRAGLPFAPPQVWITVPEFSNFPENEWHSPQATVLRDLKYRGIKNPTYSDVPPEWRGRMVREHEGRHRLWFAREVGETQVPVQVWLRKEDPNVPALERRIRELEEVLDDHPASSDDLDALIEEIAGERRR